MEIKFDELRDAVTELNELVEKIDNLNEIIGKRENSFICMATNTDVIRLEGLINDESYTDLKRQIDNFALGSRSMTWLKIREIIESLSKYNDLYC